ncbi:hypothetical protein LCGC14_0647870 [marine sediment metagenome]|uniref:Uncharacterized protein n=1 Tax=marine sediment metagenome TaxID=412755 RepID=A0A0F9U5J4_9ZZZZ
MPRAKDAPTRVGGQIDPYVQRSIQQSKQQAESRLVAAMQEVGATQRTGMQEAGATQRAGIQAGTQRTIAGARLASEDRRAAEAETARREDMEFTKTMTKINQELQSKEAGLDRDMQRAMFEKNIKVKKETMGRQLSLDRFRAILGEKAQIRDTNAMMSMFGTMTKKEEKAEKIKTTMLGQADEFDDYKEVYDLAKENIGETIRNDKRMDLPARKPRGVFRGAGAGMTYPAPAERQETLADPMGVLQDLITREEGKISVENLSSANIHKVEERMINGEVDTENINSTFGALHAMRDSIAERRDSFNRKSDEWDFWNDKHIDVSQFIRSLTGLEDSTKPIKDSKTETVGKKIVYSLRTIRRSSLGNQVSRYRAEEGDVDAVTMVSDFSKSLDPYEPMEITPDMNQYDIENWNFYNNSILPLYQKFQSQFDEGVE